jgi:hypothetical protein
MVSGLHVLPGVLLLVTALLTRDGPLTATTITLCWCVVLFFASAGASGSYLTVSEIFPVETRALAVGVFWAAGTGVGRHRSAGLRPPDQGREPESHRARLRDRRGADNRHFLLLPAERRSLESIARPLTAIDPEPAAPPRVAALR